MLGVNKVILIGNLGKDPELRRTSNGNSVASFTIATTERWNDKNSGGKQEHTEWHNIVVWGKLAELAHQYLKKGKSVYIEGKISTRSWDDKDGIKRYKTEIVANQLQFLGSANQTNTMQEYPAETTAESTYSSMESSSMNSDTLVEDDLPF